MGDRGNICIKYRNGEKIYFYTHWGGSFLNEIVKNALIRGISRWIDAPYLARIIFSEMIKEDIEGTTGFGIAPYICDNEHDIVTIDMSECKVNGVPFEVYINE